MKTIRLLILLIFIVSSSLQYVIAQNTAITDDAGYTPNSSAMLDVKSTTKGMLIPRLTTSQRNLVSSPATGLLVYDTNFDSFFFYDGSSWVNLTSGNASGVLSHTPSDKVFLTDVNNNLGVGSISPNSKLEVKSDLGDGIDDPIFAVINNTGDTVFAVFPQGVRINVYDDPNAKAKSKKGGFAVGGFSPAKGTTDEFLRITSDSIRMYVKENTAKAASRKGGFAVGGFSPAKGTTTDLLTVSPDSIRMYIEEGSTKAASRKGGFAVGGFSPAKGTATDYFNIFGANAAEVLMPSEPRIFWYPKKEAFLTGRVIVQSPDSVGTNSFASGYESKAIGNYSQALGYKTIAKGEYSTAIGKNSKAIADNSFAFGEGAKSSASDAYAFGSKASATGIGSYAFGSVSIDTLGNQTGVPTSASGTHSIAFGQGATASALSSMSIGTGSVASGAFTTAIGFESEASGKWSLAIGRNALATGERSMAIGPEGWFFADAPTKATNQFSAAIGPGAQSTGYGSTALGLLSFATGQFSVGLGAAAQASGENSLAGQGSTASGYQSVALGGGTASGDNSVALGGTSAFGVGSVSLGSSTSAKAMYSATIGRSAIAESYNSVVLGRFNFIRGDKLNWVSTDDLFVIGNGSGTSDRSNAFTILKNAKTGINTSDPESFLHVKTDDGVNMKGIIIDTDSDYNDYAIRLRSNSSASSQTDTDTKFLLTGDGAITTSGGITINEGTKIKKLQHGSYNSGTNYGVGAVTVKVVTVTFTSAFTSTPKVNVTVKGGNYSDVFAITTRNITTTSFQVNIYRVDSPGGQWAQTLYLDWMAWE